MRDRVEFLVHYAFLLAVVFAWFHACLVVPK